MQKVFVKVAIDLIDNAPHFFSKLKAFIGEFTIEGTDYVNFQNEVVIISFYTDKLNIPEGKSRQVDIVAMREVDREDWKFTEIKAYNSPQTVF